MTGETVRRLRHARNLSQHELAMLAGLHYHTIERVERGRRVSRGTLRAIARALDVSLDDLETEAVA